MSGAELRGPGRGRAFLWVHIEQACDLGPSSLLRTRDSAISPTTKESLSSMSKSPCTSKAHWNMSAPVGSLPRGPLEEGLG